jgi:hypothetical protein
MKLVLAERLAKQYAALGDDDIAEKQRLRREVWEILEAELAENSGKKMVFAYIKAASKDESDGEQLQSVREYADDNGITIDRVIEDNTILGEVYQSMKLMLRRGDTLIVKELCCLGYNMAKISEAWRELGQQGVDIIVVDNEQLSTADRSE